MKTIYKYPIETVDRQEIEMPRGARVLCVQTQNGTPCLWALVEPDNQKFKLGVVIKGTGHPINSEEASLPYIGTYQLEEGALVFHVFVEV